MITKKLNGEFIYYGDGYEFKFTDEKYHRYATLIVRPQHIKPVSYTHLTLPTNREV